MLQGTHIEAELLRVVDGDTLRIRCQALHLDDESVRLTALDTEESSNSGPKPQTLWGKKAKEEAEKFFAGVVKLTLEFPGNEQAELCLDRYRGNNGRLLVFVHKDGQDFQEHMIRQGYSPYFVKYGNVAFREGHIRYSKAEMAAQADLIGIWNQKEVNGYPARDYAQLSLWWQARAHLIERYRFWKNLGKEILTPRLDYRQISSLAQSGSGKDVFIFTEIREIEHKGRNHAEIKIGSGRHPFSLFIPDISSEEGEKLYNLLHQRYSPYQDHYRKNASDSISLARNYVYVRGQLNQYRDRPQMLLLNRKQIQDDFDFFDD